MNNPNLLAIVAIIIGFIAALTSFLALQRTRRASAQSANTVAVLLQMEASANDVRRDVETLSRRGTEQARRVAWLESRVRERAPISLKNTDEEFFIAPAKTTMTERRHRVLTLARRCKDSNQIAATLGMSRGEVELILNLSIAA